MSSSSTSTRQQPTTTHNVVPVQLAPSTLYTASSTWKPPANWNLTASFKQAKRKTRTVEDDAATARIASRVSSRLAADHSAVTAPDVDTPFVDALDVVNRLLPYHVYQQPKEDLYAIIKDVKGKRKVTDHDLKQEIDETKFALDCFHRRAKLQERFRNIRTKSGTRITPHYDQAIFLEQSILESEKTETSIIGAEMKTVRAEYDKMEREKRAGQLVQPTQRYYNAPPALSTTAPVARQPYYHTYPYNFVYGSPGSATTFSIPLAHPTTPGTTSTPMTVASVLPASAQPLAAGAVPIQLPLTALPILQQHGIYPVVPSPSGPTDAPVILRASSANGAILHLEFNIALLSQQQRDGLMKIVNVIIPQAHNLHTPVP